MPFIVFQSDEPFDLTPYVEDGTLPMTAEQAEEFRMLLYDSWQDAMADLVSQVPGARFITDPHSGHYIHQERPKLVIDSVREVVAAARKKSCALDIKNHGQCVKADKACSAIAKARLFALQRGPGLIAAPALSLALFTGVRGRGIPGYSSTLRPCADLAGDQNLTLDHRNVISGISASDGRRPRTL